MVQTSLKFINVVSNVNKSQCQAQVLTLMSIPDCSFSIFSLIFDTIWSHHTTSTKRCLIRYDGLFVRFRVPEIYQEEQLLSFRPRRALPYMGYIGMCNPKEYVIFSQFCHKWGINFSQFWPFWSEIWYGFCTLVLILTCF